MARGASSSKKEERETSREPNPELRERKRLKRLAFADSILSETPAKVDSPLSPSKAVIKHHGKDILKRSQRKNKFLFSFPGLLAPTSGGKIGELKDLGTKNPVLYLDFPQGRMKLFGTIVYPKNRYLTLQFSRGGKNVMCEDYFDNMIVFLEAWWIGRKDDNPEEAQLNFPKELVEGSLVEYNFKGGAGATSVNNPGLHQTRLRCGDEQSPEAELEVEFSDDDKDLKDLMSATPVRYSERTAGRIYNFAEGSPGDDSVECDADVPEGEEKKLVEVDSSNTKYADGNTLNGNLGSVAHDIDNKDAIERTQFPVQNEESAMSVSKLKGLSHTDTAGSTSKKMLHSNHGSLVQATISTLFKKAEEKKPRNPRKSPSPKVSGQKLEHTNSKTKIKEDGSTRKEKVIKEKDAGGRIMTKKREAQAVHGSDESDEIDESDGSDGSDEDWAA